MKGLSVFLVVLFTPRAFEIGTRGNVMIVAQIFALFFFFFSNEFYRQISAGMRYLLFLWCEHSPCCATLDQSTVSSS